MLRPGGLRLVALLALLLVGPGLGCGARVVVNSDVDSAPADALRDAERLLRAGDQASAEEAFSTLLRAHPDSWRAARGLQDARRASLARPDFEALYVSAQQRAPDEALAWYLLGRARIDRPKDALQAFERAAELAPQSPWPPAGVAYVHWVTGDIYLCVEAYEAAIERMPRSAQLRLLLGNQLLNLRLVVEAQRHLELAHRLDPASPEITAALGKLYVAMDRYEAGRALLEEALANDPTLADVMMSLAGVYLRDREPVRAEAMYRRALEHGMPADDELFGAIRAAKLVERTRHPGP